MSEKEFDIIITVNISSQVVVSTTDENAQNVYEDIKARLEQGDNLDSFTKNAPTKVRLEILHKDIKELDRVVLYKDNTIIFEEDAPNEWQ